MYQTIKNTSHNKTEKAQRNRKYGTIERTRAFNDLGEWVLVVENNSRQEHRNKLQKLIG